MRTIFAKSSVAFVVLTLTFVIHMGCSLSVLEQNKETVTPTKSQESIFTVIETADVENPNFAGSIRLPFRTGPNNTVVLSGKHAYLTTKSHLHVIDVTNPQQPSYMTSIAFTDDIGKARASGDRVFVASRHKIYLVDVSSPLHPVVQSVANLHHSNAIKGFDIHESHLYIMDVNAYLHIYAVSGGNAKFVEAVEIISPSLLAGVRAKGSEVEQILLKRAWIALSDRTNLLELSGRHKKVRVSEDHLVFNSDRYPHNDIVIVKKNKYGPGVWEWPEYYNLEANYLAHLYLSGKKIPARGEPTEAFIVDSNQIQLAAQDQWSETVDFEENHLLGPTTDFQISGNFIYVSNAIGFLSIIHLDAREKPRFLSATMLPDRNPISVAVGGNYTYVLCDPSDLE